jgi:hypothetical protein
LVYIFENNFYKGEIKMKIIKATEILVKKSKDRNIEELEELRELILLENRQWFKNRIWIDDLDSCLVLNVDEVSFNLNGSSLEGWLQENTDCDISNDKRWRVFGIKRS